jgi:hypothetical protein
MSKVNWDGMKWGKPKAGTSSDPFIDKEEFYQVIDHVCRERGIDEFCSQMDEFSRGDSSLSQSEFNEAFTVQVKEAIAKDDNKVNNCKSQCKREDLKNGSCPGKCQLSLQNCKGQCSLVRFACAYLVDEMDKDKNHEVDMREMKNYLIESDDRLRWKNEAVEQHDARVILNAVRQ